MKILVAAKQRPVFDALHGVKNLEVTAALDTRRVYEAIPGTQLAVIDYHDLVAQPFSIEFIQKLLSAAPSLKQCNSAEFLASPDKYLNAKYSADKAYALPPKRTIAFTSFAGGTGKTSFALDTALHFARQTSKRLRLPAAVMEFTYGSSALQVLAGGEQPLLSELILQPEREPYEFQGVALYPMDYQNVVQLPIEQFIRYYCEQSSRYVLTVIDTMWPHGLVSAIGTEVDQWVVLTTPRIDAVENARKLQEALCLEYGEEKVIVAANQMSGLGTSLAMMGLEREIEIPRIQQSDGFFDGRLGKEILTRLYPSMWQQYEKHRVGLFRKR